MALRAAAGGGVTLGRRPSVPSAPPKSHAAVARQISGSRVVSDGADGTPKEVCRRMEFHQEKDNDLEVTRAIYSPTRYCGPGAYQVIKATAGACRESG